MDSTTIFILIAVIVIAGIFFMRRNRPATPTYDDKDVRSGGSIGGGTRAHDDPKVRSGGSIGGGGGAKVYDAPDHASGGSIGNQSTAAARRTARTGREAVADEPFEDEEKPRHNDPNVKSKGSFGS